MTTAMEQTGRRKVSISLFRPLVAVDSVDGRWFAVVTDGTTRIQVVEWPLQDHEFDVDGRAIFRIELYLAGDATEFLEGHGQRFAELHIPVAKGTFLREWFGLQRGCHHEDVDSVAAAHLSEAAVLLSRNLLTPKVCCSIVEIDSDIGRGISGCQISGGLPELPEPWSAAVRRSFAHQSNIIVQMHQQLRTLWSRGRVSVQRQRLPGALVCGKDASEDEELLIEAQLTEHAELGNVNDFETARLQEEVHRLTDFVTDLTTRLEESSQLRYVYQRRLEELTGKRTEEGAAWPTAEAVHMQELEHEVNQLREVCRMQREHCSQLENGHKSACHMRIAEDADVLELRRQNKAFAEESRQHGADVAALRDELRDTTSRLVEAWSFQAQAASSGSHGVHPVENEERLAEHPSPGLAAENARLEREMKSMRAACDLASRQCGAAEMRAEQLQREVDRAAGEAIANTKSKLAPRDDNESSLREELESLRSRLTLLQSQNDMQLHSRSEDADRFAELTKANELLYGQVTKLRDRSREVGDELLETQQRLLHQPLHSVEITGREVRINEELNTVRTELSEHQVFLEAARELQRRTERELGATQDAANGELDELRRSCRVRVAEFKEQAQLLREELAAHQQEATQQKDAMLRPEEQVTRIPLRSTASRCSKSPWQQRRGEEGLVTPPVRTDESSPSLNAQVLQAEIARREAFFQERESRFRSEIKTLEDANEDMSQKTNRQTEEMTRLQGRVTEVMELRREQERHGELQEMQLKEAPQADSHSKEDPRASIREGYSVIERRVAQLEAQLRASGGHVASRRRQASAVGSLMAQHSSYHGSAPSTGEPRRIDGTPPGRTHRHTGTGLDAPFAVHAMHDLAEAREKVAEMGQQLVHLEAQSRPVCESQAASTSASAAPTHTRRPLGNSMVQSTVKHPLRLQARPAPGG